MNDLGVEVNQGKINLKELEDLVKSNKTFSVILDYALFASQDAKEEGDFDAQARIFSDFNECLDALVNKGIIVMKSGQRYTGSTKYFELAVNQEAVSNLLKDYFKEIEKNMEDLKKEISYRHEAFYYIFKNNGKVDFSVDNYMGELEHPYVENLCVDLVRKGLMFSWTWITRNHKYRRYKFREQPINCLQYFLSLMNEYASEFIRRKIENYLTNENAAKLDFLLGLIRTRNISKAENYLKERGWSEKLASEVERFLEEDGIPVYDLLSSPLLSVIEGCLSKRMDEIDELAQVKKSRELDELKITFRKEKVLGRTVVEFADIVRIVSKAISELSRRKIEILRVRREDDKFEVDFACSRKLYSIMVQEGELYSLPSSSADKSVIIGKRILDYAFNQFLEQRPWDTIILIGYEDGYVLGNIGEDVIVRFILESLRENKIFLVEPVRDICEYYTKSLEDIKKLSSRDEGFVYTEPYNPWLLQQEFLTLLRNSKENIKICVPYPDESTFSFLATVPPHVEVKMLILSGKDELKSKKLTTTVLEKTIAGKRIEIRRNPEIHIRFIISDNKKVLFSSADLRDDQLKRKYQYGFWTNNEEMVRKAVEYFENLWKDSRSIDLFQELKE